MLSLKIALRYLFSRKSHSVVNMIAVAAVLSIAVPVAATILVLSLHSGLTAYIEKMYSDFDPPIKIMAVNQRFFVPDSVIAAKITQMTDVRAVSASVESEVMVNYGDARYIATLMGVDSNYLSVVPLQRRITHGEFETKRGDLQMIVVGQGIAYNLNINTALKRPLTIFALTEPLPIPLPMPLYNTATALPSSVYAMDEMTDSKYMIADLGFAQKVLGRDGKISSWNIVPKQGVSVEVLRDQLSKILGTKYSVTTAREQRGALFGVMNIERWVIYALLVMITAIASLSLIGAVVMMITEKEVQNNALMQMGLAGTRIRKIFFDLGVSITVIGLIIGLIVGVGFVVLQQQFGFLRMGGSSLLLESYPVELNVVNITLTIIAALIMGCLVSFVAVKSMKNRGK